MTNDRTFTVTWTLDAPAAEVFRAWTEPDKLDWFYNDTMPVPDEPIELDLRVGGVWRQQMVISESTAYPTGGVYREIVRDEKLVFSWGAEGGWPELDPRGPRTARSSPCCWRRTVSHGDDRHGRAAGEHDGRGHAGRLVRPHAPRLAGHGRPACCVACERTATAG